MVSLVGQELAEDERLSKPIHHRRHVRITCIGAGAAGLLFAYKVQQSFDNISLTIYEKNSGVGGTWFENRYPGVACDYPAHNYTYTFEPKPDWPSVYVSGSQVRQYFEDFAGKYNLVQYCQTGHEVTHAQWLENEGQWRVQVRSMQTGKETTTESDILISATGVLNRAKWPDIPGIDNFKGQKIHSANWPKDVGLKGKRVGLIGNGSSGQQILETIQPTVCHLTTFIRQGTWVFGPFGPSPPREYTPSEIETFQNRRNTLTTLRKSNENRINCSFPLFLRSSPAQANLREHLTSEMKAQLQDPDLEAILIPTTGVGCRRPTPGINYISAVTASNVTIAYGPIAKITPNGAISTSDLGVDHSFDVLICATGFDTSYTPRFPIINGAGANLQDEWSSSSQAGKAPAAYFATAAPEYPNYVMFYGPGNPWASGSYLAMLEAQAEYILKLIDRFQSENWHSFAPKSEAVEDLMEHSKMLLKDTVWAEGCNSWYKAPGYTDLGGQEKDEAAARLARAEALSLWPGSGLHFIEAMADLRADDWEITYKGNRFAWLGNGSSRTEADPESDKAWYIRDQDVGAFVSREKRRNLRTSKETSGQYGMGI